MFEEAPGHTSSMRVMSMLSLLAAIAFGYLVVSAEATSRVDAVIVLFFLIAATAPKVLQKFSERPLPFVQPPPQ
jgi:hypothetical protein